MNSNNLSYIRNNFQKANLLKVILATIYSTVTDFARFLGLSILFPRESAK